MTVNEGQETVVCKHLKRCLLTNNSTVEDTTAHITIILLLSFWRDIEKYGTYMPNLLNFFNKWVNYKHQ